MNLIRRLFKRAAAPVCQAGLDLSAVRSLSVAEVEARHPVTGEPLGAFFALASPDHPARLQARIDIARAHRGDEEPAVAQAIEMLGETAADFLGRIVLGWRGVKDNGAPLDWSPEAARALFARPEIRWLTNQLLEEAGRLENFIETSAPG